MKQFENEEQEFDWFNQDNILHTADIVRTLGISERTLSRYKQKGAIRYCRLGNGTCIYLKDDICRAIMESRVEVKVPKVK